MGYQENQSNYLLQRLRNGNNTTISCAVLSSIPCEICSSKCEHLVSQLLQEEQVFCSEIIADQSVHHIPTSSTYDELQDRSLKECLLTALPTFSLVREL